MEREKANETVPLVGQMDEMEAGLFETNHLYQLFIKIRQWDDEAKIKNALAWSINV